MAKKGVKIFIETLVNAGVKRVYGVVGEQNSASYEILSGISIST
jgi:thiamine pyrophosphate-dependent acetolactate synthase large subunit-like protein